MKINGKSYSGGYIATVVLPRGDDYIVFKCQAVMDYKEFDELCPRPDAPTIVRPNGEKSRNYEDPAYNKKLDLWANRRTAYMIIQSLEATEGLEWDTVKKGDPDTWKNFEDDLKNAGITQGEINALTEAILTANGLNQEKIKQATEAFLAGKLGRPSDSGSQQDDPQTT